MNTIHETSQFRRDIKKAAIASFSKDNRLTLQQMLFDIDGTGSAAAFFRKKLVGMTRRAVRIVERTSRYLFYRLFLHQI